MTINMANCQAVMIGDNVYIGGGDTYTRSNAQVVMVYNTRTKTWAALPPYDSQWFGMAAINDQLVVVGGSKSSSSATATACLGRRATNKLGVWDDGLQTWTHPFPDMPTSRHSIFVVSYQRWLVVAGGDNGMGVYLNKVELLDTHSKQWYEGLPLPKGHSSMSSTIYGNMWYLSSGLFSIFDQASRHVFGVCLDDIIFQAISRSAGTASPSTQSPWQILTDTPLAFSTILILNGALMAIGGKSSSAIHHYQPSRRSWVKVSDLPTKRSRCACVVLPNGEIFVAGGQNEGKGFGYANECFIATTP